METTILTEQKVLLFRRQLQEEERSPATIEKYLWERRSIVFRSLRLFLRDKSN